MAKEKNKAQEEFDDAGSSGESGESGDRHSQPSYLSKAVENNPPRPEFVFEEDKQNYEFRRYEEASPRVKYRGGIDYDLLKKRVERLNRLRRYKEERGDFRPLKTFKPLPAPKQKEDSNALLSGLIRAIKDYRVRIEAFRNFRENDTVYSRDDWSEKAEKTAAELAAKYNVTVRIVRTLEDYHSEDSYRKMIEENIYSICDESPIHSADETEVILKYVKARERLLQKKPNLISSELQPRNLHLLDLAHAKATEKANKTSQAIGTKLEQIIKDYQEKHKGKPPALSTLASILNSEGVPTPTGKPTWFAQTVKRVMERSSNQHNK